MRAVQRSLPWLERRAVDACAIAGVMAVDPASPPPRRRHRRHDRRRFLDRARAHASRSTRRSARASAPACSAAPTWRGCRSTTRKATTRTADERGVRRGGAQASAVIIAIARLSRQHLGRGQERARSARGDGAAMPRPYLADMPVGLIATAYGWQATGLTIAALRSIVHALRGWPTPFAAAINTPGHQVRRRAAARATPRWSSNSAWSAGRSRGSRRSPRPDPRTPSPGNMDKLDTLTETIRVYRFNSCTNEKEPRRPTTA